MRVRFFTSSIIVEFRARLFPITKGHNTFLLLAGKPNLHKVYSLDAFIRKPW